MAASIVFCLVLAHAAYSLAVPIQEINYIDFDKLVSTFLNEINEDINDYNVDTDTISLDNLQESRYECNNLYSDICNKNRKTNVLSNEEFKQKTAEFYTMFKQNITDLLNKNEDGNMEMPSVDLERLLYQKCMKLGTEEEISNEDEDDSKSADLEFGLEQILNSFLNSFGYKNTHFETWQQSDQYLAALGFGHAFYDISVIADPFIPNQNIILLQPPSIKKWNSIKFIDTLSDIYVHLQAQLYEKCVNGNEEIYDESSSNNDIDSNESSIDSKKNSDADSDEEPAFLESYEDSKSNSEGMTGVCEPFKSLTSTEVTEKIINQDEETILIFFNRLLKAIFDSISVTNTERFHTKLTIKEWNTIYNSKTRKSTSKIDWFEVIKSEFEKVGISVNDTEYIFIKNVPYFYKLAKYLSYHGNEIYDKAVQSKLIAENARYIDWEWIQEVNSIDQSTFCFEQTQLFGVSQEALRSVIKNFLKPHVAIMEVIVNNVAQILNYNISENENLNDIQRAYMKSQLQAITINLLSNKYDRSDTDLIFEDYYANFNADKDYYVDINNYRKMIKNNILKTLRSNTPLTYDYLPFDINEIENPRNRLILYTLSSIYIESLKPLGFFESTEQYYATFGVKVAGFLYSLISENKFQSDVHDLHGDQWLNTHVSYSPDVVKCFVSENIVAYGYQLAYSTITEIFSVRLALAALLKDYDNPSVHDFYKAYIENHCGTRDRKMIQKVLSNLEDISSAFACSMNENSVELKCEMTLFQK